MKVIMILLIIVSLINSFFNILYFLRSIRMKKALENRRKNGMIEAVECLNKGYLEEYVRVTSNI